MTQLTDESALSFANMPLHNIDNKKTASQKDLEVKLRNLLQEHDSFKGKESILEDLVSTYQLILKNVRDVIWIMDLKKMEFVYESPSVFDLRGYTPEEAIALSIEETITPKSVEMVFTLGLFCARPALPS